MEPQRVADYLLKEGYLLTALELHAELSEKGKPLSSLTQFFQDSKNFEVFTTRSASSPQSSVSGSQFGGLDDVSLFDLTRNSEDWHHNPDDRVAVLEFELRKARETIFTLRDELTQQTKTPRDIPENVDKVGNELAGQGGGGDGEQSDQDDNESLLIIKGHEQRILNFLINEYLLQYGFKLTSITFSDENNDADYFEDWDNIGINVTKPPNLLKLYRDYGKHFMNQENEQKTGEKYQDVEIMTEEDSRLIELQEKSLKQNQQLSDLETKLNDLNIQFHQQVSTNQQISMQLREKESVIEILRNHPAQSGDLDTTLDVSSRPYCDVETGDQESDNEKTIILDKTEEEEKNLSRSVQNIMRKCSPIINDDDEENETSMVTNKIVTDNVIDEMSICLPKIVPNTLINKREELLPLFLTAIQKHPDTKVRDQLLHLLFNLTKKPDSDQRKVILRGFKKMARTLGHEKVETELLPQLWEQLDHKHPERRLLVAETCAVLLPYIPNALISSLVFSMLQQLVLEDKDLEVRQSAIKSLSILVCYLDHDSNKTDSVIEILASLLDDPNEDVIETAHETLLKSVANWLILGNSSKFNEFVENRLEHFLQQSQAIEDSNNTHDEVLLISKLNSQAITLKIILPFVIASLIKGAGNNTTSIIIDGTDSKFDPDFVVIDQNTESLKEYLSREWYESWSQLEWFKIKFVHIFVQAISKVPECLQSKNVILIFSEFFTEIFDYVGKTFVKNCISPIFNQYLPPPSSPSPEISTNQEFSAQEIKIYESCILPVYVQGVLVKIDTPNDIANKLQDLVIAYNSSTLKTTSLSLGIEMLVKNNLDAGVHDAIAEMAWTMLVHINPKVKMMASLTLKYLAIVQGDLVEDLIGHKILPGLVTLSSDPDPEVRASALIGLAYVAVSIKSTSETKEKAAFQLISFLALEHENDSHVQCSSIEAIGFIMSKENCPHKIRDDLFLPKISDFTKTLRTTTTTTCNDTIKIYENLLVKVYNPICSGTFSGYLDDVEPPPSRLSLNVLQQHVVPGTQSFTYLMAIL